MALLSFPSSPTNGQLYPTSPLVGQNQYQWSATDQVWRLLGSGTGVAAGTYGDATNVGQFTVDATGKVTFAQNVPIAAGAGGTVTQVDTGLGLTGGPISTTGTISALQATPISEGIVFGYTDGVSVALGVNALFSISSGINNTAIGDSALLNNGVGNNNTAVGTSALCANVGGSLNTAVGVSSLKNSTGTLNTATGFGALINSTIGSNNAGFGADAGFRLTTGACNTALGTVSLFNITTGSQNVGVGYSAGCNITTGSQNVAIGSDVTVSSATGSCQLAIGFATNQNWLTGDSSKAIKPGAGIIDSTGSCGTNGQVLMSTGANSVCWGGGSATPTVEGTVFALTDGAVTLNTALGFDALNTTATGAGNVAVGPSAGCALTTGNINTFIGAAAGCAVVDSTQNIAIGFQALGGLTTGIGSNIAIGSLAGIALTNEDFNVVIGAHPGPIGLNCQIILADGQGTLRAQINECGAISPDGATYGTLGQFLGSNGATSNWSWFDGVRRVATPANSAATGALGEVAMDTGFFYWFDGTQWLRAAGSTF